MSALRRLPRRRHRSRGQGLVELALILPVMLLLLLGALDLGRVFYAQITINNAAREGALVASQGGTSAAVRAAAVTEAKGGFVEVVSGAVTPGVSCIGATFGATTTVDVSAPFEVITPLIRDIAAGGGQSLVLSSRAEAQCLVVPVAATPPLPCPTVSFTWTHQNQFRMDLVGSISPLTTGWSWTWSLPGGVVRTGNPLDNYNFGAADSYGVTLTVSKDACTSSVTQTVTVP